MDPEELQPKRVADRVAALARDDLSYLSIDELKFRISSLETEIARSEAAIASKQGSKEAAQAFFKK
ncbi:MAG: DUF1192 domain-containing protein [Parvibaculum sp.]